jgi:hypothetical protein
MASATDDINEHGSEGTAFLSTPSLYFSVDERTRAASKLFDVGQHAPIVASLVRKGGS